jgi:hypothetical protein
MVMALSERNKKKMKEKMAMAMDDSHCCYYWSYIRKKSKKR